MDKRFFRLFITSFDKAILEIVIFTAVHALLIFLLYSIFKSTAVAATALIWVIIISWRNGVGGAIISVPILMIGSSVSFSLHPGFINTGSIKEPVFGAIFQLIMGTIFGYISNLVYSLKNEIQTSASIQKELLRRNMELDAFGHTVAHDIKNYLNILSMSQKTLSELLSNISNPKIDKYLDYIKDSSNRMANLLEDILLLAGLSKNQIIEFEIISTEEIVKESLQRMHFLIKKNHAKIILPKSYPTLHGYFPWIVQMYVNYLSNAIKYGGDDSRGIPPEITLGFDVLAGNKKPMVRCWVKDNGAGIKPELENRIFNNFNRYNIKKADGHGFGLPIVKLIAEKLEGTVGVAPDLNRGTTFFFNLPKS